MKDPTITDGRVSLIIKQNDEVVGPEEAVMLLELIHLQSLVVCLYPVYSISAQKHSICDLWPTAVHSAQCAPAWSRRAGD